MDTYWLSVRVAGALAASESMAWVGCGWWLGGGGGRRAHAVRAQRAGCMRAVWLPGRRPGGIAGAAMAAGVASIARR